MKELTIKLSSKQMAGLQLALLTEICFGNACESCLLNVQNTCVLKEMSGQSMKELGIEMPKNLM